MLPYVLACVHANGATHFFVRHANRCAHLELAVQDLNTHDNRSLAVDDKIRHDLEKRSKAQWSAKSVTESDGLIVPFWLVCGAPYVP